MEKPETCPQSGHPMKEKQKRDGTGSFWGCTGYPECRFIYKDPLVPPRNLYRPPKTEQVRQMQETKAGFIKVAQDNKNDSIRLSGSARDATLIITTFFKDHKNFADNEKLIKSEWLKWREWLYNRMGETPQPDKPPFENRTMNAPEFNQPYVQEDDTWPPEEVR